MANEQGLSPISIRSHLKAGGLNLQLDRLMAIDSGMLGVLKGWKQRTQFASEDDWILQAQFSLAVFRSLIPGFGWRSKSFGARFTRDRDLDQMVSMLPKAIKVCASRL